MGYVLPTGHFIFRACIFIYFLLVLPYSYSLVSLVHISILASLIMLAIKLQRKGKKKQPSYRLVVQEKRSKLGGLSVEDLGWYDPISKKFDINGERTKYWLKVGAKPTPTVNNLLINKKVIEGKKIPVHKKFIPKPIEEVPKPQPEAQAEVKEKASEPENEPKSEPETKPAA